MWVGPGDGALGSGLISGPACLSTCEADVTCVGLQMYSNLRSQCYKLTDDHIKQNIGQGHIPISIHQAKNQPPTWSVFVMAKVQAPHPPITPSPPSPLSPPPSPPPPSVPPPDTNCPGLADKKKCKIAKIVQKCKAKPPKSMKKCKKHCNGDAKKKPPKSMKKCQKKCKQDAKKKKLCEQTCCELGF